MTTTPAQSRTAAAAAGRKADSARRRQRVITAINQALTDGTELSVAQIARTAAVDRSFLYRHRDLLEQLHATDSQPRDPAGTGPTVTRASLQADLLAAHERAARQAAHVHRLEKRLSALLGEHAWHQSGLGAPVDIDELQQRITGLQQQVDDLRLQLAERGDELAAARAANRELMLRANTTR